MANEQEAKGKRGRPQKPVEADTFAAGIGRIIRAIRESKGLTVEECAATADVSIPTWYHFERGRSIGLDKLPRIAGAMGVRVKELIPD
jgi:transcriptional regulator with XRE-family HTH domain